MIYFVTGNDKKWSEIESILGTSTQIKRSKIDLPELQGASLEEIAIKKVETAYSLLGTPVIIEDTALCFKALKDLPGAYVKWFLDAIGPDGLARMLDGFECRQGEAVCTMAYHDGQNVTLFQGKTGGVIAKHPQGETSFGWDPIFIPTQHDPTNNLSYAQLSKDVKNSISHRAKALKMLKDHFDVV